MLLPYQRFRALLAAVVVLVVLTIEVARAHSFHTPRPVHGGQVAESAGYHVELVVDDQRYLRVYLRQANGMLVAADEVSATATVRYTSEQAQLALEPGGSAYLMSTTPLAKGSSYRTVLLRLKPAYAQELIVRFNHP